MPQRIYSRSSGLWMPRGVSRRRRRQSLHRVRRRQGPDLPDQPSRPRSRRSTTTAKRCAPRRASASRTRGLRRRKLEPLTGTRILGWKSDLERFPRLLISCFESYSNPTSAPPGTADGPTPSSISACAGFRRRRSRPPLVVDVIEMEERKDAGVGALAPQVHAEVDRLELLVSAAVARPPLHSLKSPSRIFGGAMRPSCTIVASRSA